MADNFALPSEASASFELPTENATPDDIFPPTAPPKTGVLESVAQGAQSGATAGWNDELSGVAHASGLPSIGGIGGIVGDVERFGIGAARLAYEHAMGIDGPASKAYAATRDAIRERQKTMREEHPVAFGGGELGGAALSMLALPEASGPGWLARAASAGRAGAVYGAAQGAGDTEGGLVDRGGNAVVGGVEGALGGVGGELASRGAGWVGRKVYDYTGRPLVALARGLINPEQEAMRRGAGAILDGQETIKAGKSMGLTPQEWVAAKNRGEPVMLADLGGETGYALARSSANTDPEARAVITSAAQNRFQTQGERAGAMIRSLGPNGQADAFQTGEDLLQQYNARRAPLYNAAYRAGDRPIWSPELERLAGAPAVQGAMKSAVTTGANRAGAQGFGAFNPGATVTPDGRLLFQRGANGMPTYPNLQYWDYAYRDLRDAASKAFRAGESDHGSALKGLADGMRNELDRMVPQYANARGFAARYFGGDNALEAGANAVKFKGDPRELQATVAKITDPDERDLFTEGYVSELANRMENVPDRNDITKRIMQSPMDRRRIESVIGPQRTQALQAFLDRETIYDRLRGALGNSSTARQLIEAGLAGGGIGAYLGGGDPSSILQGAGFGVLGAGAGRVGGMQHSIGSLAHAGAQRLVGYVDRNTARRVADFLTSDDENKLFQGLALAQKNRGIGQGLRDIADRLSVAYGSRALPKPSKGMLPSFGPADADQQQEGVPGPLQQQHRGGAVQKKPEIRRAAMSQGFPLFAAGGAVRSYDDDGGTVDPGADTLLPPPYQPPVSLDQLGEAAKAGLGPIWNAGESVGDMMRTGAFDPAAATSAVGDVMMGAAPMFAAAPARAATAVGREALSIPRTLAYELDFGAGAPYNAKFPGWGTLTPDQKSEVSAAILPKIVDFAKNMTGANEAARIVGLGGWGADTNAAFKIQFNSPQGTVGDVADVLGYLGQQTKIFGYRAHPKGDMVGTMIYGPDLGDPAKVSALWTALREEHPDLAAGFSPSVRNGVPGIEILNSGGAKTQSRVTKEFVPAIQRAVEDQGLSNVDIYNFRAAEESRAHDWQQDPTGSGYIQRLAGRYGPGIQQRLEAFARSDVEPALAQALRGIDRGGSLEKAQAEAAAISGGRPRLKGLPAQEIDLNGKPYFPGPVGYVHDIADQYMKDSGLPYEPPTSFLPVDKDRATRIAQAFEDMKHDPSDPGVQASYNAMIDETLAQYQAIKKAGIKFDFIKPGMRDPYESNPRLAAQDLVANKHLWVLPTEGGFGSGSAGSEEAIKNNPLLRPTGEYVNGHQLLANDVFRIVHDVFGHFKEGNGFRSQGEDNAWRSHAAMYSPLARPAMTAETRGQNSWVNYGPHGAKNRTASSADTVYADQKIGRLPDWVMEKARGGAVARAHGGRVIASNINHEPSEAQKEAGNYAKDHIHKFGLPITIENAKGSMRRGIDRSGKAWACELPAHYGYLKGTEGRDNDHVDCYVGPHHASKHVFIIDQVDANTNRFDEHKVMLGMGSLNQALAIYKKAFSDGRGKDRIGKVSSISLDAFKRWLEHGDTKKPYVPPDTGKKTHADVSYVDKSPFPGKTCALCSMFISAESGGPACTAVMLPIFAKGHCRIFQRRQQHPQLVP